MRIVQTLLGFFLIAFILLGNAGIRVFKHSCEEEGIFTSYILPVEDHCQEETEDLPECCLSGSVKESCGTVSIETEKDDCCSDEVDIYTVDFNFFQDSDTEAPLLFADTHFLTYENLFDRIPSSEKKKDHLRPPPDPPSGRDILILHQVFRI